LIYVLLLHWNPPKIADRLRVLNTNGSICLIYFVFIRQSTRIERTKLGGQKPSGALFSRALMRRLIRTG
jgi:hypothetical protein